MTFLTYPYSCFICFTCITFSIVHRFEHLNVIALYKIYYYYHQRVSCRWDDTDVNSDIAVKLTSTPPTVVITNDVSPSLLQPPTDRSYCGLIYAILQINVVGNNNENAKFNNFAVDNIVLKCDKAGEGRCLFFLTFTSNCQSGRVCKYV